MRSHSMQHNNEERGSIAVANAPRNDNSNGQSIQFFADQRPESAAQQEVLNLTDSYDATQAPAQFYLPGTYKSSNAPGYNPHGKKDTYRSGVSNYNRLVR